jgi:RecB family exonuclease
MKYERLSASKLQTYLQCPQKYYAVYELGIPEKIWPSTAIGLATHKILELLTTTRRIPDIAGICAGYRIGDKDVALIKSFVRNTVSNGYFEGHRNILGCETKFKIKIGSSDISGIMDRVDRTGDVVKVIDIKTGKAPYTAEELKESCQKKIYSIAAYRMYPDIREVEMVFWFVRQQVKQPLKICPGDAERFEHEITVLAETIKNDIDHKPSLNKYCNICCYQKQCSLFRESWKK